MARHPLLLPPRGTGLRRVLDRAAANVGAELQAQVEIDGVRLMASLAFEGYGAAIVPATAIPRWLQGDFRRISVPELPRRVVGWAQRRRPTPGAATRSVLAALHEVVAEEGAHQPGVHVGADVSPHATLGCRIARPSGATAAYGRRRWTSRCAAGCRRRSPPNVRDVGGREVVWVDVDASTRSGALSSESSLQLEHAARTAASIGIPLVCVMRSSGADIVEGFAALHGWGRAGARPRRVLGRRPDDLRRRRAGGVRSGTAASAWPISS